jgi:hypothetical protein
MRELFVIGIGARDPDQVTVRAIKAATRVDSTNYVMSTTRWSNFSSLLWTMSSGAPIFVWDVPEIRLMPRSRHPGAEPLSGRGDDAVCRLTVAAAVRPRGRASTTGSRADEGSGRR